MCVCVCVYSYTFTQLREDFSKIEFPRPVYFQSKPLARILRWRQYARRRQDVVKLKLIFFSSASVSLSSLFILFFIRSFYLRLKF